MFAIAGGIILAFILMRCALYAFGMLITFCAVVSASIEGSKKS